MQFNENLIETWSPELIEWRRDLHAHPELAFEEHRTAAFVADKLREFGIEVHTGLGRTGVVGVLRNGTRQTSIGLRADMDALPIQEHSALPHRSTHAGKMHACGHDGHTIMLLGAARYLAATKCFDGVVHFIFQPAEENESGAQAMVRDKLFDSFSIDAVYALHNAPGLPTGMFASRAGAFLASMDRFELRIRGQGSHAATPHLAKDPVLVAAHIVTAWQAIVSRQVTPLESAVVSVTRIHGGETWNAIPTEVVLGGTVRSFNPEVRLHVQASLERIAKQLCEGFDLSCEMSYLHLYPALINSKTQTEFANDVAASLVTDAKVIRDVPAVMGSDDFAFMLQQKPGAYLWIGNGAGPGSKMLHHPEFDFNDDVLCLGSRFWCRLVQAALPLQTNAR